MLWVGIDVGLAVAGLAVLAGFAWRLWRQVRQLGRQVSTANDRIATVSRELSQLTPPGTSRP
jgi:hypothetical protein